MKKLTYLSLFVCAALHASEQLEAITITSATKSEKSIDGVVSSVIVLTEKDIQESNAGRLHELLNDTPSLTMQNGAFPAASSKNKSGISIRGIGAGGTLFLINGKRLAGEVKNPYDLDRIPASMIERVEIIKGPASALYGSDAMGGVINIITKKPTKELHGSIGLSGSTSQKGKGSEGIFDADVRGRSGNLSYSFSGNIIKAARHDQDARADVYSQDSTGKVKPSAHQNGTLKAKLKDFYNAKESLSEKADVYNFDTRLNYDFNESFVLGVDFNYLKEEREGVYIGTVHPTNFRNGMNRFPAFNVPVRSKDNNERFNAGIDADFTLAENLKLFARTYHSQYKKRNATTSLVWKDMGYTSEEASKQGAMDANVKVTSYESYLQYLALNTHLLTFGGEYRDEEREATVFRNDGKMSKKSVDYKALYIQDDWDASDSLSMLLGARYDDISNATSKATFKFGLNYALSDNMNLRSSFSQGYRSADIRELYINKRTPAGHQLGAEVVLPGVKKSVYDLKPEFVNAYEAGMSGRMEDFRYDFALFYNVLKDRIEMVRKNNGANNYFTFENIQDAYTAGIEANISYSFSNALMMKFNWSEMKSENKKDNKKLLLTPERSIVFKTEYKIMPTLTLGASVRHIGAQEYEKANAKGKTSRNKAEADTFLDLSADYKLSSYTLFAKAQNILDEKVDENILVNRGRMFYAGIRYFF